MTYLNADKMNRHTTDEPGHCHTHTSSTYGAATLTSTSNCLFSANTANNSAVVRVCMARNRVTSAARRPWAPGDWKNRANRSRSAGCSTTCRGRESILTRTSVSSSGRQSTEAWSMGGSFSPLGFACVDVPVGTAVAAAAVMLARTARACALESADVVPSPVTRRDTISGYLFGCQHKR